ncbi:MAG: hypothetical protein ABIL09_07485 [Gemmatimonadota bacterium]
MAAALQLDPGRGALDFGAGPVRLAGWGLAVEAGGRRLASAASQVQVEQQTPLRFRLSWPAVGLEWSVTAAVEPERGAVVIESALTNTGSAPLALGRACLLDTAAPVPLGPPGDLVGLPLTGELGERCVWRLADPDCPRTSKVKLQLYNAAAGAALQVGFLTFHRADTTVEHDWDPDAGLAGLRAACDFAGWELPPGRTTPVETFCLLAGADPFGQLVDWADRAAARCAPRRWEDAPVGWVGWSWVDPFNVETYEEVVLRNCQAVRRRLAGFGVDYVWVSIGNLAKGTPGRWLDWDYGNFPSGPHHLAARLRELGLRWGLWCGVFWLCAAAEEQARQLEDALLRQPDGSPMVVRAEWQYGSAGLLPRAQRPCIWALDPSHPKTLAFLRRTFETWRAWGVRYYMLDFLHAGAGNISSFPYESHFDRGLVAGPEVYHRALEVVRRAAGDDTYFLSSTGPSIHNAGIMDAIRTGNDFGEGRSLYPDSYFYPATSVINSGAFWTGPARALQNQASAFYTHRRLYLNDSGNVLTVDQPLALEAARLHATIHAFSGGPSMLGDDVDRMSEARLALVKKTLPRPRDVAFPVDLFTAVRPDHPKVFHRRVDRPWGRFDVVAIYNFGDQLLRQAVALERLGLPGDRPYLVWEFWNEEYIGTVRGELVAAVPPGAVRVYRLVADQGRPEVLGTDLHLLMGEVELLDCQWHAAARRLGGRALRPAGERGSLFVHAPPGLRVDDPRGRWIAKDGRDSSLVIRLSLAFEGGPVDWDVTFAPIVPVGRPAT